MAKEGEGALIKKRKASDGVSRLPTDFSPEAPAYVEQMMGMIDQLLAENKVLRNHMESMSKDLETIKLQLEVESNPNTKTSRIQTVQNNNNNNNSIHPSNVMVEDSDVLILEDEEEKVEKEKETETLKKLIIKEKKDKKSKKDKKGKSKEEEGNSKGEKKSKKNPCEHCNRWSHKLEKCWRKHPELAPQEWKERAEKIKKQEEEKRNMKKRWTLVPSWLGNQHLKNRRGKPDVSR